MAILKDWLTGETIVETKISKISTIDVPLMGSPAPSGVEIPRKEYVEHQERLDLITSLLGGTKAMKEAGQKFLPKETKESDENYQNRLRRTYLFNAFGRTVSYLGGQVFTQPVKLLADVPSAIRTTKTQDGYEEDIDLKGSNLDAFLKPVFERGVSDGVSCVLVDYPQGTYLGTISVADEKRIGRRPYWVHLPPSSIIGWKTEIVSGKTLFTQLRIRETEEVDDGQFGVKQVNRIRVLEPRRWTLYEEQKDEQINQMKWVVIGAGPTTLDIIPLAVFMPGKTISALTAEPPLDDLAYMNLAHWQSTSDQMNILHFTRLPILFGRKLTDSDKIDQIEIGPNRMIHSDSLEGDLKYVEHTGKSIAEGHMHLIDLETKMAMWGLQLLMPKTGTITATEKALSSGESDSTLKSWALLFTDFIEQCLFFTALYMREERGGAAEVNTQFRWMQTLDAEVLLRGAQLRVLPGQLVFEELQRRAIISDQYDYADLQSMFDEENRGLTFAKGSFGNIAQTVLSPGTTRTPTSTSVTATRAQSGTGTPYSFKRGHGTKGTP